GSAITGGRRCLGRRGQLRQTDRDVLGGEGAHPYSAAAQRAGIAAAEVAASVLDLAPELRRHSGSVESCNGSPRNAAGPAASAEVHGEGIQHLEAFEPRQGAEHERDCVVGRVRGEFHVHYTPDGPPSLVTTLLSMRSAR